MKTIYLIRHGKASLEGSEEERGLTDEGIEQSKQLAVVLQDLGRPIRHIYTSPFRRAILTVTPFAEKTGLKIQVVEDLKERKLSDGEIKKLADERRKTWEDLSYKLPGGESGFEAQDRALNAFDYILKSMKDGECAAVVSHGNLIGLILKKLTQDFDFDKWRAMTMPDIFRIDYENEASWNVEHVGCDSIETFRIGQ